MLIDGNKRKACPEKSHFVAPGFTYFVLILRSVWLIGLGWFYAFLIDKMVNSTIRFFLKCQEEQDGKQTRFFWIFVNFVCVSWRKY